MSTLIDVDRLRSQGSLLVVPHLPVSTSKWQKHYGVRMREAERMRGIVASYALQQRVPQRKFEASSLVVTFYWPDRRAHDADNAMKLLLDGLVRNGLIRDDGQPWLHWTAQASRWDPRNPRTEVLILPEQGPSHLLSDDGYRREKRAGRDWLARIGGGDAAPTNA